MMARASRSSVEASMPSSLYTPPVGRSRQPLMFISVDLPEPDDRGVVVVADAGAELYGLQLLVGAEEIDGLRTLARLLLRRRCAEGAGRAAEAAPTLSELRRGALRTRRAAGCRRSRCGRLRPP